MPDSQPQPLLFIRPMERKDLAAAVAISWYSEKPWTQEQFLRHLGQRDYVGMVAVAGGKVVGYMVYELREEKLKQLALEVDPKSRNNIYRQAKASMARLPGNQTIGESLIGYLQARQSMLSQDGPRL